MILTHHLTSYFKHNNYILNAVKKVKQLHSPAKNDTIIFMRQHHRKKKYTYPFILVSHRYLLILESSCYREGFINVSMLDFIN